MKNLLKYPPILIKIHSRSTREWLTAATILVVAFAMSITIWMCFGNNQKIKDPDDPAYWINQLHNQNSIKRLNAISVLLATHPKSDAIRSAMIKSLNDPDPQVRAGAIIALRKDTELLSRIKQIAAEDEDPIVREIAHATLFGNIIDTRDEETMSGDQEKGEKNVSGTNN